jgi:hypothetical protein
VAALDSFGSGSFTGGGGAAFPEGEIARPLLSSWDGGASSATPNLPDFGIGRTALTGELGSADASATPAASPEPFDSFFAVFAASAGMNRGLVGRDEAARLAAEAGGGVEPDADALLDDRIGEVLDTVTGSFELSKTCEFNDSLTSPEPELTA